MWIVDTFLRVQGAHCPLAEILVCCTADFSYCCLPAPLHPVPLFGGLFTACSTSLSLHLCVSLES